MIVLLLDVATFLLVLFVLLPVLIYSVYVLAFTKHFHSRDHEHIGDIENLIPH